MDTEVGEGEGPFCESRMSLVVDGEERIGIYLYLFAIDYNKNKWI
jgi:hypothetical protein